MDKYQHHHLDARIVNGIPTIHSNYPFIAGIRIYQFDSNGIPSIGDTFCGASLIRKQYPAAFLTASHCVFNMTDTLILQITNTDQDEMPIYGRTGWFIIAYIIHELFDSLSLNNDIAIVFIDTDLSLQTDISIVTIPDLTSIQNECCQNNDILQVIGYGRDGRNGLYTDTLEYTNITFISRTACNKQLCRWET